MEINEFIVHQRDLLAADKVFQCIEDLFTVFSKDREMENSLILLMSQYNKFLNQWRGGLQTKEESNVERSKIKQRLLSFLEELDINGKSIYYELPHLFLETNFEEISVDERVLWRYIDRMGKSDGYKYYLSEFPNGFYVYKANMLLSEKLPTTIPKNRTRVTCRLENNHLVHHEFYQNQKFTSKDFLSSIAHVAHSVLNVKINTYGDEWVIREYYTSQVVDGIADQAFDNFLGKEYEIILLEKESVRLTTNVFIDTNKIEYETQIREDVLPILKDATPLKSQVKNEIKEILKINKNKNDNETIFKESWTSFDEYLNNLRKNKIAMTKGYFILFLTLYILLKIIIQHVNGNVTGYSDTHFGITFLLYFVCLFDFAFLYYFIDLMFYDKMNVSKIGHSLSIGVCLFVSIWVMKDWSIIHEEIDILILVSRNGALLLLYLIPLFVVGLINKIIATLAKRA